jgi:hypothetical protein
MNECARELGEQGGAAGRQVQGDEAVDQGAHDAAKVGSQRLGPVSTGL